MKRTKPQNRRVATRRRSRYGSVLILVVALLVLMALIGTAWISSARVDRAATYQHASNTQIDLLVEGVVNMVDGALVKDVIGADTYRAAVPLQPASLRPGPVPADRASATSYTHWDDALTNKIIASRVPVLTDDIAPYWTNGTYYARGRLVRNTAGVLYASVNEHFSNNDGPPSSRWTVVDFGLAPVWPAVSDIAPRNDENDRRERVFEDIRGKVAPFSGRTALFPDVVQVGGNSYPGFRFYHPDLGRTLRGSTQANGAPEADPEVVIAGDADGDGMADSLLFRLPVGRLNGLDYFAAVRVVDNNSAINVSTAWQSNHFIFPFHSTSTGDEYNFGQFPGARINGTPIQLEGEFFPSNVNLRGLLYNDGTNNPPERNSQFHQIAGWNRRRMSDPENVSRLAGGDGLAQSRDPIYDLTNAPLNDQPPSVPGTPVPIRRRTDYRFVSPYELLYARLASRLDNPGWWWEKQRSGPDTARQMLAAPMSAAAMLAYKGGTLVNTETESLPVYPGKLPGVIEDLNETLYQTIPNAIPGSVMARKSEYPHESYTDVLNWFNWLYHYRSQTLTMPRVGSTPEAPGAPASFRNRRSLLTVRNPVSNAAPTRSGFANDRAIPDWNSQLSYAFGDRVNYNNTVYMCVAPFLAPSNNAPDRNMTNNTPSGDATAVGGIPMSWKIVPPHDVVTKASVNSGDFMELWSAFWNVMAEDRRDPGNNAAAGFRTPFSDLYDTFAGGPAVNDPYLGTRFNLFYPYAPSDTAFAAAGTAAHPLRMFRSPIRRVPPAGVGAATTYADNPRLTPDQVVLLRAALAAVNAMDLRDTDDNVTIREINLGDTNMFGPTNGVQAAVARVYGLEPQPYITEVFAHSDALTQRSTPGGNQANPAGYVAIELHNPYPFAIDIGNCRILSTDRSNATPRSVQQRLTVIDHFAPPNVADTISLAAATSNMTAAGTSATLIPARGYLVLENFSSSQAPTNDSRGMRARARPASTYLIPNTTYGNLTIGANGEIAAATGAGAVPCNFSFVPNLDRLFNREFTLVRPQFATHPVGGTLTYVLNDPAGGGGAGPAPRGIDMAPLDSFDLTGLPHPSQPTAIPNAYAWHYARASQATTTTGAAAATPGKEWRFVYPGRYDAGHSRTAGVVADGVLRPRHQGTDEAYVTAAGPNTAPVPGWNPTAGQVDPWSPTPARTAGDPIPATPTPVTIRRPSLGAGSPPTAEDANGRNATYPVEFTIQVSNVNAPGPVTSATPAAFPFGAFPRNGDILQVPYIGSYRIQAGSQTPTNLTPVEVAEINPVTMDSVFAEDTDTSNDPPQSTAGQDPQNGRSRFVQFFARPLDIQGINGLIQPIRREQIGRFCPSLTDLMVYRAADGDEAAGWPNPNQDQFLCRNDELNGAPPLTGWEITIVDGPGKGQTRIISGLTGNRLTVTRQWSQPAPGPKSRCVLRPPSSYRWATDLFDYVTVQSPKDDQLPEAPPQNYGTWDSNPPPPQSVSNEGNQPGTTYVRVRQATARRIIGTTNLIPTPGYYKDSLAIMLTGPAAGQVRTVTGSNGITIDLNNAFNGNVSRQLFKIVSAKEDTVGVDGLININTAPAMVLSAIPFVPPGQDTVEYDVRLDNLRVNNNGVDDNEDIARAITRWRDGDPGAGIPGHGPFRSIFDLYKVPAFLAIHQRMLHNTAAPGFDPDDAQGDLTPYGANQTDGVHNDFEEQFLLLNRISNLITTRSDTFTCYILVQGWRGVGTGEPELVVQRRRAFFIDRTGVTAKTREVSPQFFYND